MISAGGKYWAVAGSGAANGDAAPAPRQHIERAFAFMDAFLVCDLLAARRDLSTREPAEEIPSGAAPTHSPIRVARCASERRLASLDPEPDESLRIALKDRRSAPSYHILRKKRNSARIGSREVRYSASHQQRRSRRDASIPSALGPRARRSRRLAPNVCKP